MSITNINQNVAAMNAQRNLALNSFRIGQSMEKLSSGLRINRAADDPAGLVMSEALRAQISGLDVVQQNVQEGVNLIKTAEGALTEVNRLLRQVNDLALNSASNSTNTAESRAALQEQVESALTTIDQIANNTKYAGINLLDGTVGVRATVTDVSRVQAASFVSGTTSGDVNVNVTQAATTATATTSVAHAAGASQAVANAGTITINGTVIGDFTTSNTIGDVMDAINARSGVTGVTATLNVDNEVVLAQSNFGSDQRVIYVESANILNAGAGISQAGVNAVATVTGAGAGTYDQGLGLVLEDANGNKITLTTSGNNTATDHNVATVTAGAASFQVGLTASETASISISSMTTGALSVNTVDVSSVAGAQTALTAVGSAMQAVSALRGQLGAFQSNELEAQGRSLAVARENLAASESVIRDTDFGKEMAEFSTAQILVQSATAFLAQANSMPQNVLQLIRG